jgi:uncharacterized protein
MKRRLVRIALILLLTPPLFAAVIGWLTGPAFLHPIRRELTPQLVREADSLFSLLHAQRGDFDVRAADGALLRGWKVRAPRPNGNWVLLFHGVADNRMGVLGQAELLLKAGYSVVMMDSRAHGQSEGAMATYGWLERNDTHAVVDALLSSERDRFISVQMSALGPPGNPMDAAPAMHVFALGESMGAGIALQSAAVEPRIEAVVAEASFANLTEAAYDYAGFRRYPWIGKTFFAPGAWMMVWRGQSLAGFPAAEVSPQKSVAARAFPVLLICDTADVALPCRHTRMIYDAARGPRQMWVVPHAFHTAAIAYQPEEFRRRVLAFYESAAPLQVSGATGGTKGKLQRAPGN